MSADRPPRRYRATIRPRRLAGSSRTGTPRTSVAPIGRAVVLGLAVLFLGSAFLLTGWQWLTHSYENGRELFLSDRGSGGPPPPVPLTPRSPEDFTTEGSWLALDLLLDDLDIDAGELTGSVSATIDTEVFAEQNPGLPVPADVAVTVVGLYRSTTAVRVPLTDVRDQSVLTQSATVPVRLEAWGSSASFPHDAYSSNNFLMLQSDSGSVGDPTVRVELSQKFASYDAEASVGGIYLNFLFERSTARVVWTYVIATSPMVLLFALVWFGLTRRQTAGASALEVVVGLFALLPLRQVLVPPQIVDITWLDTILGLELMIFVAWLVIAILYLDRSTVTVRKRGR